MKLYELSYSDFDSSTRVFRSLKEARAFVRAEGIKLYKLDRIETAPLTLDLLIDVINSCGGSYCLERETIFNNLF